MRRSRDIVAWWDELTAKKPCWVCNLPIGTGVGIFRYLPSEIIGHGECVEEKELAEAALLANPFAIERAARHGNISIEQFYMLPKWEKERLLQESEERDDDRLLPIDRKNET